MCVYTYIYIYIYSIYGGHIQPTGRLRKPPKSALASHSPRQDNGDPERAEALYLTITISITIVTITIITILIILLLIIKLTITSATDRRGPLPPDAGVARGRGAAGAPATNKPIT